MFAHSLQRLALRRDDVRNTVSFNEATGEVCTSACRRKALLDAYHYRPQHYPFIPR